MRESVTLYNGRVVLYFDAMRHAYLAEIDGTLFVSAPAITAILKVIGKGDALTQWSANCAADHIRETLRPGVPLDEIGIEQLANDARFAFRRASKKACDIGTLVHQWIEAYLVSRKHGAPVPQLPLNEDARRSCNAAIAWISSHRYLAEDTETRLYSLKHGYAGTTDSQGLVASVNRKICIVDWKTSKAIYPEYRFQTAAYAQAFSEMSERKIRERWIVRIGKDGELEYLHLGPKEFKADLEAFLAAKKLYERLQVIQN